MTGQKNRFKTTEKLWDLDDKQLKTPKHDAMVLWLMDKDNYINYFDFPKKIEDVKVTDRNGLDWYTNVCLDKIILKSELPIMSSKTFIAGYADLAFVGSYLINDQEAVKPYYYSIYHIVEVKPYIDSFGAVLRQINSYKQFRQNNRKPNEKDECYYIFTFDNRFDNQFESQGIKVLHPPEDITIEDIVSMYGV